MAVRQGLKEWLQIVLMVILILAVSLAILWGGLSIYANIVENNDSDILPKYPNISKAQYTVYIKATGNVLLTDNYEHPTDNLYILHGYWEISNNKYKYHEGTITLDSLYFGDIIINRRAE